jgi:hypothetical protein
MCKLVLLFVWAISVIGFLDGYNGFFRRLLRIPPPKVLQIGFLHGSHIPNSFYKPFLDTLRDEFDMPLNITYLPYFPQEPLQNNTIIMGHSFGGFFGLLYCIMDQSRNINNVKGCVLLNSHFNERYKMPYIGVKQNKLKIPVLTLLNRDDDKLPLPKALDDYEVSIERKDTRKRYIVNSGTHSSSFTSDVEMELVCKQIKDFVSFYGLDK